MVEYLVKHVYLIILLNLTEVLKLSKNCEINAQTNVLEYFRQIDSLHF